MIMEFAQYTDMGNRCNNEDALQVSQRKDILLAVVSDGLGGHIHGEQASRLATDSICSELENAAVNEDRLAYGILHASDAIIQAGISGHATIAVLWIQDTYAVAAHVGDTRIYQFRNNRILYQSSDHSLVQIAVQVGNLKPEALRRHPDRNKLFRVLGDRDEEPKPDCAELSVQPGDRFLICSDGFWEQVTEADMLLCAKQTNNCDSWLKAMRKYIADAADPSQDNHTAICIMVQ